MFISHYLHIKRVVQTNELSPGEMQWSTRQTQNNSETAVVAQLREYLPNMWEALGLSPITIK